MSADSQGGFLEVAGLLLRWMSMMVQVAGKSAVAPVLGLKSRPQNGCVENIHSNTRYYENPKFK